MGTIEQFQQEYYNKEFYETEEKKALQQLADNPGQAFMHHKMLGFIYETMHRHDDCVYHAEKAIALAKSNFEKADARVIIARSHIYRKEINLAIAQYLMGYDEDSDHDAIVEELAHCYRHLKDYDNAEHWYKILCTLEGCQILGYTGLGDLYSEKKEYDTAIDKYLQALTIDEDDQDALHGIGVAYAETGRNEQAMSYFLKEKELYPQSAYPLYSIGLLYQRQEEYYRALHYYTEALKIAPDFSEVYNNMAVIHLDLDGDIKTALAELEKAASLATDSQQRVQYYMNLSRLYSKIKDDEKHMYWQKKLLDEMGFGGMFSFGDDEDGDGDILK